MYWFMRTVRTLHTIIEHLAWLEDFLNSDHTYGLSNLVLDRFPFIVVFAAYN